MRLEEYLAGERMSVRTLARKAGVAHSTITRLLRGQSVPALPNVRLISGATEGAVSQNEVLASFGSQQVNESKASSQSQLPKACTGMPVPENDGAPSEPEAA